MVQSNNAKTVGSAIKGFSWNVAGNATRSIAGFIINILLARLLGPRPFGVVAIALLIVGVGNLVIESGLSSALVQKEEVTERDISFVFTLQMTFAILLVTLVVLFAPWLSVQFSTPEAVRVIQVMALMLVIQAFAQVPSALLRRDLLFQKLQMAQVVSFLVGFLGLGLPLAFRGFGVWSLVAAQISQNFINAGMVYYFSRHSLAITFKGSKQLGIFGARVLGANIASWIIQYVDQTIIGKRFGAENLGLYSRAYFLSWTPLGIVLSSAQASLFSAVSRMGKSNETIQVFRGFLAAFALFFFSAYWWIALEAQNIILFIYGKDWLPAASLLAPLAVAMPFIALVGLEGPVLNGLGKPHLEMRAQWVTAIFAVLVLTAASGISIAITAWSILLICLFRLAIMTIVTIKTLEISLGILIKSVIPGLLLGLLTVMVWSLANVFLHFENDYIGFMSRNIVMVVLQSLVVIKWKTYLSPNTFSWRLLWEKFSN